MIKVKLDLGPLAAVIKTARDKRLLNQALLGIAESARDKWAREAMSGLNVSRQAYLMGLGQPITEGLGVVSVELKGALANKIERGAPAFDLRPGILADAKVSKAGHRYAIVPFRHQTPGTRGAASTPMDQTYAPPGPNSRSGRIGGAWAADLGKAVYKQAKNLRPGQPLVLANIAALQPHHEVHAFQRLYKSGGKGHRYYVTFRTVSDRVPKFHHPGFEARGFMAKAIEHANTVGPQALKSLAGQLMREAGKGK